MKYTNIDDYIKYLFSLKSYYIKELYDKLLVKYDRKVVDKKIYELTICGYLNDKKLLSIQIDYLINERMYGRNYIYNYFINKGLSKSLIDYVLSKYPEKVFLNNKDKLLKLLKEKQKGKMYILSYLLRKGYDIDE